MLRQNHEALNSDELFRPKERIPKTGVYESLHANGDTGTVVLIRNQEFPACTECGMQVRFRLVRAAPHITEDVDFR